MTLCWHRVCYGPESVHLSACPSICLTSWCCVSCVIMQTNDQGLWFVYAKDFDEILMGCPYWPGDVMILAFDLKFERLRV